MPNPNNHRGFVGEFQTDVMHNAIGIISIFWSYRKSTNYLGAWNSIENIDSSWSVMGDFLWTFKILVDGEGWSDKNFPRHRRGWGDEQSVKGSFYGNFGAAKRRHFDLM